MFVARWPVSVGWDLGWRKHSQIAHYVAGRPAYLYAPSGTALHGEDGTSVHLLRYTAGN